ncbi:tetratricopeptide repeat protein [Hymenobacter ruricola]|uniref:Tetratricopeptide repeat protein n=1 Tax=Hymenobacter ruricola TaxID=2791023 RepID=A0ABS0I0V1_9BACT|nr:tetratricopeptide repeat protein [Hymenobacter ruricola]MBF9220363.1 tetratricopeptide repeat protein [Hymenobacter ruricola]
MRTFILTLGLAAGLAVQANAQSAKETALAKGQEAIKLMDDGHVPESIKLLEEAAALDPTNYHYGYELALAHYMQKEYPTAIALLTPLADRKEASERTYQLLGNSYDLAGQGTQAAETYNQGLKKFPESGPLHLELGNLQLVKKDYAEALKFYEKGIELAPTFPSNYYRAAKLYLASNNELWGMIYGELFMNLERNSARTAEMSKLLFDTYKSEITFPKPNSASVSFGQNVLDASTMGKGKDFKLPYSMAYETTMGVAVATAHEITLASLNTIRTNFINTYYDMKHDAKYPNVLFDYQRQIAKAGHAEAYNYWLLMKGDEDGFDAWAKANPEKWKNFVAWYQGNALELNARHRFYRAQY